MAFHITHVSTVHSRYDTRILENQCVYLAAKHKVSLFVTDGMPEELYAGVSIRSVYRTRSKFLRLFTSFFLMPLILLKKKFLSVGISNKIIFETKIGDFII